MIEIIWSDAASDRLADYYVAVPADQKETLAEAAEIAQQQLRRDPWAGESREGGIRLLFVGRLGLKFRVLNAGDTVRIIDVVWSQRRKS
jgi:hypothetical protein